MARPTPVEFGHLLALQQALQGIAVRHGFHHDVKPTAVSIDPQEILLVPETELPFWLLIPDAGGSREWFPDRGLKDVMAVTAIGRMDVHSASVPGAKLRVAEELVSDLERAVAGDVSLGGRVNQVRVGRARRLYGLGEDPIVLVQAPLSLLLPDRTYGQPDEE